MSFRPSEASGEINNKCYNKFMTAKILLLAILSIFAGLSFIIVGIYFLSQKFLDKLNESNSDKRNEFRAKGSGLTSISLGALTIVWALLLFSFPEISKYISLIYMFFLILAFSTLVIIFKQYILKRRWMLIQQQHVKNSLKNGIVVKRIN